MREQKVASHMTVVSIVYYSLFSISCQYELHH